ncbi:MAG: CARDB domain-containing protein, partial [Methanobacteriota archaeon]
GAASHGGCPSPHAPTPDVRLTHANVTRNATVGAGASGHVTAHLVNCGSAPATGYVEFFVNATDEPCDPTCVVPPSEPTGDARNREPVTLDTDGAADVRSPFWTPGTPCEQGQATGCDGRGPGEVRGRRTFRAAYVGVGGGGSRNTAPTFVDHTFFRVSSNLSARIEVEPGARVRLALNFTNDGVTQDVIDLSLVPILERPAGYERTFDPPSPLFVDADATREVNVSILVPNGSVEGDAFESKLSARSQKGPHQTLSPELVLPRLSVVARASAVFAAGFATGPGSVTALPAGPGDRLTYRFDVTNAGNRNDSIVLSRDVPRGYVVEFSENPVGPLPPRATRTIVANVTVPGEALAGNTTLRIVGESENGTASGRPGRATLALVADVAQRFGVEIGSPTLEATIDPGRNATIELRVTNTGNGNDTFGLGLGDAPPGWRVDLANATLSLGGFEERSVALVVTPPETEPPGTVRLLAVGARSFGADSAGSPRISEKTIRLTTRAAHYLELGVPENDTFVVPGETLPVSITVDNDGNEENPVTLSLTPILSTRGGILEAGAWNGSLSSTEVRLPPGEEDRVTLSVRAPVDAVPGDRFEIRLAARSGKDATVAPSVVLRFLASGPDLSVSSLSVPPEVFRGDVVEVSAAVANVGNRRFADNADLKVSLRARSSAGSEVPVETVPIAAPPAGTSSSVRLRWNASGLSGNYTLVAEGLYTDAQGVPRREVRTENNRATNASILRVFDVLVTVPEFTTALLPGTELSDEEFSVANRGSQAMPVRITATSPRGFLVPNVNRTATLPVDHPLFLPFSVRVPQNPGVLEEVVRVKVSPIARPDLVAERTMRIRVEDRVRPEVLGLSADPPVAAPGAPVTLVAVLFDNTEVGTAVARIRHPDGTVDRVPMSLPSPGIATVNVSSIAIGEHTFVVELRDRAGNDNTSAEASFRIVPGDPPVLALEGPPNGSLIRSGTPVRLAVSDRVGLREVRVVRGAVEANLQPPYEIDTATYPEGAVDLVVTAENVQRVVARLVLRYRVDNTPPAAEVFAAEDLRAGKDAAFVVRAADDQEMGAVRLVLMREGAPTVEVDMRQSAVAGDWRASARVPDGDFTARAVAVDAAGNEGFAEREFSVGTFGLPGPGVGAVVAAVLFALAARRRRE